MLDHFCSKHIKLGYSVQERCID